MNVIEVPKTAFPSLVEGFLNEGKQLYLIVKELSRKTIISCRECGVSIEVYPPDQKHTNFSLEEKPDSIKMTVECENKHKTDIYWHESKGVIFTNP